jgi:hypothetical protein
VTSLLNTKMPSEQAVEVARRFGLELSRCFIHREAHRQGLKAEQVRQAHLAQLDTWELIQELAASQEEPASVPFTLVLEIDAWNIWNIRERDNWGRTEQARQEARRQNKQVPSKWHWVYVATVFRLDHRGQTAGGRPIISQRGYVCTRLGIADLMRQLYRQAIESTCRQYQCRFKRTGQFWSMEGDETLMCLETVWRNGRWHDLFPHAKPPSLANN